MKTSCMVCGGLALLLGCGWEQAQADNYYKIGQVVTNFSVVVRHNWTNDAGQVFSNKRPLRLSDFAGSILFLDFFDPTCSSCQDGAQWAGTDIKQWYRNRHGSSNGLPVVLCSVNIVPQDFLQTYVETFIEDFSLELCANDYNLASSVGPLQTNAVHDMFQPPFLKPVFMVINCVSNSPNTPQWTLLMNDGGEGQDMAAAVVRWRSIIDSVQAPRPALTSARLSNGVFQFTFPGQQATNRVECSSNWLNWTTLTNVFGTNGPVTFRDPVGASGGQRFYRVRRL